MNAARLAKLGIRTVRDLLLTLPFGWESYESAQIDALVPGRQASVVGTVLSIKQVTTRFRKMQLTEALVGDEAGTEMRVVWFKNPYIVKNLREGDRVALAGQVKSGRYGGGPEMTNPHYERLDADVDGQPKRVGGRRPKYHLLDQRPSRKIAGWVAAGLPRAGRT